MLHLTDQKGFFAIQLLVIKIENTLLAIFQTSSVSQPGT